jgi:hypothetical protein
VGVSFQPGYPDSLYRLQEAQERRTRASREPLAAILVRNPYNEFDSNAIEVHAPSDIGMVGHLPAALAERLAPLLDEGEVWQASFGDVLVHPDKPEFPGVDVRIERVR